MSPGRGRVPARRVRRHSRVILMTTGGVIVMILMLVVALNLDKAQPTRILPRDESVVELFEPQSGAAATASGTLPLVAAEAGWIESVDPKTGRLRQRHRFDRLDPSPEGLPAGWLALERPEAQIFLSGGRVVTLRGDSAVAHAPQQTLEQGTLRGNVLITMHEQGERDTVDPILTVRTEEASFDQRNGEVRCDGRVLVELVDALIPGERLSFLYNDMDGVVERLVIQQEYVLLKPRPEKPQAGQLEAAPSVATRARGAGRSGAPPAKAAPATKSPAADSDSTQVDLELYRLTMNGNVRVRQQTADGLRTATGDTLGVVFSARGRGLEGSLALGPMVAPTHSRRPAGNRADGLAHRAPHIVPLPLALARLALGWSDPLPAPAVGETIITADGPMMVVPMRDRESGLTSPEDQLLTLSGRPMVVIDEAESATATAAMLRYHTLDRAFELIRDDEHPVTIDSPSLTADGDRFWYGGAAGHGGMSGAGTLALQSESAPPSAGTDDPLGELRVSWTGGVDLDLDDGKGATGGTGATGGKLRLRRAVFDREVRVNHPDLELDADRMTVGFAAASEGDPYPESILAEGVVRVRRVADYGTMSCGLLDVSLTRTPAGNTQPTRLRAEGDVEAVDGDQVMWADLLLVTFHERVGEPAAPGAGDSGAPGAGSTQVETLTATGDVQVLLADGSRAFGDRLEGDAGREVAELSGREVVVVLDEHTLIDHGMDVRLVMDRAKRTARWEGPGVFHTFGRAIVEPGRGRIDRPRVNQDVNPPEARARWNQRMVTDAGVGAGQVDLFGEVDAVFGQTPLRRDTMRGAQLSLFFDWSEDEPALAGAPAAANAPVIDTPASTDAPALAGAPAAAQSHDSPIPSVDPHRKRVLRRLLAQGDARLESRQRSSQDAQDPPRVFFVGGDSVEYDHRTGDATVLGRGTLLVQDLVADDPSHPSAPSGDLPFSGKGTTMFSFRDRLELRWMEEEERVARMFGEVAVRHQGLDGRLATLTSETASAWLRAVDETGAPAPGSGGTMALRRVRAVGSVFVRAASREVECDDFDHDVATGIARVSAVPGRLISIITAQARIPYTAQSVVWDLRHDRISVTGAGGTGGR